MAPMTRPSKDRKAGNWSVTVPAFGDWDQKSGSLPDYSLDFSKVREVRKQNKNDFSMYNFGNSEDFSSQHADNKRHHHRGSGSAIPERQCQNSPKTGKKIMSYFKSCVTGA